MGRVEVMWLFSDVADWWDEKKEEAGHYLHEFVDEHYSWWAIAIAGSVQTAMNLGGGFVDVLRIGDGVRQGTWRGFLHDGLRLLALIGPAARLGRGITRLLTNDPGGPICAWVSATQALRQTGVSHLATLNDLVAATGRTPGSANIVELASILRSVGADVRQLATPSNMEAVEALVRANPNGVVMFGVEWFTSAGRRLGHALYAFRNIFGKIKIVDRGGRVVDALSELADRYPGIGNAKTMAAAFVRNAKVVQVTGGASMAALEVTAVMMATRREADRKFAQYKAMREAGHSPTVAANPQQKANARSNMIPAKQLGPHVKAGNVVVVKQGDTWESIFRQKFEKGGRLSFDEFLMNEKAVNRLMGNAPDFGPLKPGMRVIVY